MKVTVHLGEPFWRAIGQRECVVGLHDHATVGEMVEALARRHPALGTELRGSDAAPAIFVDDESAPSDRQLSDGARIHIVWPASGG